MSDEEGTWFDDDAGSLVRPYAITGGRTSSRQTNLEMITLVVAVRSLTRGLVASLDPECVQILVQCQQPRSIAEISAELGLPLSVVKILIGDLIDKQLIMFRSAVSPDIQVLQAVINGIRRI